MKRVLSLFLIVLLVCSCTIVFADPGDDKDPYITAGAPEAIQSEPVLEEEIFTGDIELLGSDPGDDKDPYISLRSFNTVVTLGSDPGDDKDPY